MSDGSGGCRREDAIDSSLRAARPPTPFVSSERVDAAPDRIDSPLSPARTAGCWIKCGDLRPLERRPILVAGRSRFIALNLVCVAGGVLVTGLRRSSPWYGFGSVARYGFELLGKCMIVPWDPAGPRSTPKIRLAFERDEEALTIEAVLWRGCTKTGKGGSGSESESNPRAPVASERVYTASKKSVEAGGGADLSDATVAANVEGASNESGGTTWDLRTFSGGLWLLAGSINPSRGGVAGITSLVSVLLRFGGFPTLLR